jgi:hypothetical protein
VAFALFVLRVFNKFAVFATEPSSKVREYVPDCVHVSNKGAGVADGVTVIDVDVVAVDVVVVEVVAEVVAEVEADVEVVVAVVVWPVQNPKAAWQPVPQ